MLIPEDELYAHVQRRRKANWQRARLWHHPDCRDPDHPGCPACEETEEEENDE